MKKQFAAYGSLLSMIVLVAFVSGGPPDVPQDAPQVATGVVFHDANNNLRFDEGDRPLAGVRVSNSRQIAKTDENGRYELPVTDDTLLFVIKPRGWRTPLDENKLPQFYYNHKPHGSPHFKYPGVAPTGALPESVNFPLYEQQEPDQFRAILFGDP